MSRRMLMVTLLVTLVGLVLPAVADANPRISVDLDGERPSGSEIATTSAWAIVSSISPSLIGRGICWLLKRRLKSSSLVQ